jgi:hypothetical protein
MVTTNLIGGLGNNLFQIANILNISNNLNVDYYIPKIANRYENGLYNSPTLEIEDIFCSELLNFKDTHISGLNVYNHYDLDLNNGFHYSKIPEIDNTIYHGYFQSEKYFKDINIHKFLKVNINITKNLLTKYDISQTDKTLSIHCRFGGDRNPNTTFGKNVQHYHKNVSQLFYKNAYDIIHTNYEIDTVIVISDFPEMATELISTIIPNFKVINENTINSFILLNSTTYSIIGNSTFSWWASYLNTNNEITVCPKSEWFGPGYAGVNIDDLFPSKWICL